MSTSLFVFALAFTAFGQAGVSPKATVAAPAANAIAVPLLPETLVRHLSIGSLTAPNSPQYFNLSFHADKLVRLLEDGRIQPEKAAAYISSLKEKEPIDGLSAQVLARVVAEPQAAQKLIDSLEAQPAPELAALRRSLIVLKEAALLEGSRRIGIMASLIEAARKAPSASWIFDGAKEAPPLETDGLTSRKGALNADVAAVPGVAPGVLDRLLRSKETVVVAHGKNDYRGVAGESTWGNIAHSVEAAHKRPIVIEVDIRQAGDQFIIYHDPTFHVLVRDYQTPQHRIEAFRQEYPQLARQKEGHWDFLLLDGVGHYRDDGSNGQIKIFDRPSGREYPLISLTELLKSVERPGKLQIPEYSYEARGPPSTSGQILPRSIAAGPIALYLDFKEINHLARRLYDLSDWHWIIGSWSTEKIEEFTRKALQNLSTALGHAKAHGQAFIAVRHPRVAALARAVDPDIRIMASPDNVTSKTSADEWIRAMEPFLAYAIQIIEIKYLNHMRDPRIRAWAREHHLKILYDQIPQTDTSQFEGVYHDDLGRLFLDIVEQGANIMIQTNTPDAVQSLIDKRRQ